jgi:hypothetical protein
MTAMCLLFEQLARTSTPLLFSSAIHFTLDYGSVRLEGLLLAHARHESSCYIIFLADLYHQQHLLLLRLPEGHHSLARACTGL